MSANNTSVEVVSGAMKYGVTVSEDVNYKNHTAGVYTHAYIRPWTIVTTAIAVYITQGIAIPVAIAPALT